MANKVRINLANPLELLELPGLGFEQAEAIVRFRAEHGPIHGRSPARRDLGRRLGLRRAVGASGLFPG